MFSPFVMVETHFGWILAGFLLPILRGGESINPLELGSSARIVGGFSASPGQFPYQVALLRARQISCGGSLIASNWVLTAAHCVHNNDNRVISPSQITVLAGTVNIGQGGVTRGVQRIIPHERYAKSRNDIALLKLLHPYPLDGLIQAIALARSSNVPPPSPVGTGNVIISGWGRLSANGPLPSILQYNRATAQTSFQCFRQTGFNRGLLCLQSPANNGACFGDSGGPAVYNQQLVGVASFIIGTCGSRAPDGYVKVSDYIPWIRWTISQNGN
ncbi:serine protease SP24D [Culex quinquefasciatus]|uniref:Serine protease SP24D n=1 Tax=Culex quinquefasciatus TaxID=7176 RepID=B0WNM9_CULQU|nr:serine protease SP24D [Culex quinquefasciatus]|eukprot:XP_001850313.1 serine protease SP24D [Culex quinquefasciatus]